MGRNIAYQTFRKYSSVKGVMDDLGYRGTTKEFVENDLRLRMNLSEKNPGPEFHLHKKRCPVERNFAWLGNKQRLAKDYERSPIISENWAMLAMTGVLLTRLF